ncbi:hypothetical protein BHE74_00020483 [Ensete ventricosum]|nr:hypothetical protein BHE74_00020483 [Ensete ventricosum]
MSSSDASLHNAANNNHSLPSSLIAASSYPLRQKAISSDLSLQSVYITARSSLSLPTVLIVASNELNTTSIGLLLHTVAPLLRNNRALRYPSFSYYSCTLAATNATCDHEVTPRSRSRHISHLKNYSLGDLAASPQNRS